MSIVPRTHHDPAQRQWHGPLAPPSLHNPHVSLAVVLLDALRRRPAHCAQISADDGARLSNGELRTLAIRVALNLQRHEPGVGHGSVVAVAVRNHPLVAPLVIGCMALAAPVNALDPEFTGAEVAHMLRLTRPRLVFCDACGVGRVREALAEIGEPQLSVYTVDERVEGCKWLGDLCAPDGGVTEAEEAAFV